jgi:TolA-binding protein
MKSRISYGLAALALALSMRFLSAGDWSLSDWLKSMNGKVRQTEEKRRGQLAAAAAIRGDKKEDAEAKRLYWKGRKGGSKPASLQELDDFKAALSLAEAGKNDQAQASFKEFLEKYPSSAMAEDARQTVALLKGAAAPTPPVAEEGAATK